MNLQQLEYIVAVDNYRHFVQAAEHCHVTQPTLSMMVKKLEDELNIKIFDRTKQPIVPTGIGKQLIEQARVVLRETQRLNEIARQFHGHLAGELRLGIIPTISPYLLPAFLELFLNRYPDIHLQVSELITERILAELRAGSLDAGVVATTTLDPQLQAHPLYRERFFAYVSPSTELYDKAFILPEDIDPNDLWLLEEGHCFRDQIQKLCELSRSSQAGSSFQYRSGSIETLIRLVERNGGITVLPEMAVRELPPEKKARVRPFGSPSPAREVALLTHREQVKMRLIEKVHGTLLDSLPQDVATSTESLLVL